MGAEDRKSHLAVVPDVVESHLRREPYCFEFFEAVQLLERLAPRSKSVGRFVPPETESVRFGAHLSNVFPASEIQELTPAESGGEGPSRPPLMRVNFMGLVGPLGVLPIYYSQFIEARVREGDTASRDFLDIFHHRLISLFYRAWQKYRFSTLHGRADMDRFRVYLMNFIGLGHPELQSRQAVPDDALCFYAGLITQKPCSAVALENVVADYFDVPVSVEQFVGAWYRLEENAQTRFRDTDGISEILGGGAVVGDEVWEPQARLRLVIGPLPLERYNSFLPTGDSYRPLRTIVRYMAGDEFDFELQLVLEKSDVPSCELGLGGQAGPRLGWLSWAKSNTMQRDPSDTILPL